MHTKVAKGKSKMTVSTSVASEFFFNSIMCRLTTFNGNGLTIAAYAIANLIFQKFNEKCIGNGFVICIFRICFIKGLYQTVSSLQELYFTVQTSSDLTYNSKLFNFLFSEPPRLVQINRNKGHDIVESVNVSCIADHVFPEPTIDLYHGQGPSRLAFGIF